MKSVNTITASHSCTDPVYVYVYLHGLFSYLMKVNFSTLFLFIFFRWILDELEGKVMICLIYLDFAQFWGWAWGLAFQDGRNLAGKSVEGKWSFTGELSHPIGHKKLKANKSPNLPQNSGCKMRFPKLSNDHDYRITIKFN